MNTNKFTKFYIPFDHSKDDQYSAMGLCEDFPTHIENAIDEIVKEDESKKHCSKSEIMEAIINKMSLKDPQEYVALGMYFGRREMMNKFDSFAKDMQSKMISQMVNKDQLPMEQVINEEEFKKTINKEGHDF